MSRQFFIVIAMTRQTHQPKRSEWPRVVLRRSDQAVVAAGVIVALVAMAAWWLWRGPLGGGLVDIERAVPVAVETKIDVNRADWPELALMPNIGESLAKRIVEDRAANGPFNDVSDLRRVRGIGPKTLESMKPFLLPLPATDEARQEPRPPGDENRP
jgi:competence protein ComEA